MTGGSTWHESPVFSVVVPAYNQAEFLRSCLQSVLDQTRTAYEVVVVNDGSTDHTEAALAEFTDQPGLHVVRQSNQGLAAARNAGITRATGDYIAFLDADDAWQPDYLEAVAAAAASHPGADAFYGAAQIMDDRGAALPQVAAGIIVPPDQLYTTLLRANFLVPSAVVAKHDSIERVGGFDASLKHSGVEDRDLWLRMLQRGMVFIGIEGARALYRIHGCSLSANTSAMHKAAEEVMVKHFGLDDGLVDHWSPEKRLAYGGHYRYLALSSYVADGDHAVCATHLRKALTADTTLAQDNSLFYELALGQQPLGQRGMPANLDSAANAAVVEAILAGLYSPPLSARLAATRKAACATAYCELAKVARLAGDWGMSRRYALRALGADWDRPLRGDCWRVLLGSCLPRRSVYAGGYFTNLP